MNICVFCGSATGINPLYAESARRLGSLMAQSSVGLVYGGGNIGLMGVVADAVLKEGGRVTGVIPDFLVRREVGHRGVTSLEIVDSMHQRKQRMADLANGFIALPGGWGTLDELAEILTWRQLGLIDQPVVILNINHFFDPLLAQMRLMSEEGFLKPAYLEMLQIAFSPEEAFSCIYPKKG
ncbi:TIGR00730 family Rossman fold protein [Chryseosolibacter histidini]|nr:TIGR00730 family Rossman fold protein [Chryseosolibacter histidini]